MENYIQNDIKKKGISLVDVARNTGLNYHTLKSQLRNQNLSGDSLMKISCFLGLNLEEMKELLYKNINQKWKLINNSEYLKDIILGEYLSEDNEKILIDIYEKYGEDVANIFFYMYGFIEDVNCNIKDIGKNIPFDEDNMLAHEISESMTKAIILFFYLPKHEKVKKLIEDKINQLINIDFNTFKGVRAFYENSVFRKNLDKLGFSEEKLDLSEFNESIIPDSLFALMELSADGYSSQVQDYVGVIDMINSTNMNSEIKKDMNKARVYFLKLYSLCKSVDRALDLADISEDNKSILRQILGRIIVENVGTFDANVQNENLKILNSEEENKYFKYFS